MSKDTGGPAFPTTHEEPAPYNGHNNGIKCVIDQGMTLRDYFAAKAMQGLLSGDVLGEDADIAGAAYEVADAMLAERNR